MARSEAIRFATKKTFKQRFQEDKWLLAMLLPTLVLLFLFAYIPYYGLVIAFQDYRPGMPMLSFDGSTEWVGLQHFIRFFNSIFFGRIFWNTIRLSLLNLAWGFWVPIVFALLLNEVRVMLYKRVTQTFAYLPYFVSSVIVVSILITLTSNFGVINRVVRALGREPIAFFQDSKYFDGMYVITSIWRTFGYSSILYLAGIAGVDPELYDAVEVDGGNRLRKMWHVTLALPAADHHRAPGARLRADPFVQHGDGAPDVQRVDLRPSGHHRDLRVPHRARERAVQLHLGRGALREHPELRSCLRVQYAEPADDGVQLVVARKGPERNRIKRYSLAADVTIWVVVGVISLLTLYPFVYILSMSISDPLEVASGTVWLLPKGFSLKAYGEIIASERIVRSFANSVLYVVSITFLCVLNSLLAGNSLAKSTLLFRKGIVIYILIPMFVGAGLIPAFIVMTRLGMFNTLWAIYLPAVVNIWNIILARTFISRLPPSLREAAYMDGATEIQVLRLVILPLSKPIIAVIGLYEAIGVWNMWLNFQIYLPAKVEWHPLQMILTQSLLWGDVTTALQLDPNIDPDTIKEKLKLAAVGAQLKYAVVIVATLPVMAIYPFVQKYFTQGVMLGSLKG